MQLARPRDARAASRSARASRTSENVEVVNVPPKTSARASRSLFYNGYAEGGAAEASDQGDGPLPSSLSGLHGRDVAAAAVADALDVQVDGEPSPLKQALSSLSCVAPPASVNQEVASSLEQLVTDEVDAAVAASPVVRSLHDLVNSQSHVVEDLLAVRASLSGSSVDKDATSPPSETVPATSASHADVASLPALTSAAVQALDKQIASLQAIRQTTLQQYRDATASSRMVARTSLVARLSPKEKQVLAAHLPSGPLDRYLHRVSHADHMAALEAATPSHSASRRHSSRHHHTAEAPPRRRTTLDPYLQHMPPQQRWTALPAAPSDLKHVPSRQTMLASFEAKHRPRYDKEERSAIKSADDIRFERASQESHDDVDANGYERDGFRVDDDDAAEVNVSFSDDDSSTDDDSCTELSDAGSSDEDDDEPKQRLDVVRACYAASLAAEKHPGDFLSLSVSGAALDQCRVDDVHVKRRTPRTHIVETIMTNWLRCNLKKMRLEVVSEFLRQLVLLPSEYAVSVYYALTKRIRPISKSFFKFIFRCVERYIPEHTRVFGHAYRAVKKKAAKLPKSTNRRKPTVRAPSIRDITDIVDATGRFYDEYRHYQRDHDGWHSKTMFECLNPSQAATFASQSRKPESLLASMPSEQFIELWRSTFGFRSSAEVLAALKRVPFTGNILSPNNWSSYHERFVKVLHQAPSNRRPPGKGIATVFVANCNNAFLEDDVLAAEPADHDAALALVLDRLNDSGFLQSDGLRPSFSRNDRPGRKFLDKPRFEPSRDPPHTTAHVRAQPPASAQPHGGVRDHHQVGATTMPPRHPPTDAPARHREPSVTCTRCKRDGHTIDSCVCKHDADGNRLPEVDDATYARRKAKALELATARLKSVHAVAVSSGSDTEDIEAQIHDAADSSSDNGVNALLVEPGDSAQAGVGIRNISRVVASVQEPPPHFHPRVVVVNPSEERKYRRPALAPAEFDVPSLSLLLCGDVEPNPGPPKLKPTVTLTPSSRRRPAPRCEDYFRGNTPASGAARALRISTPVIAAPPDSPPPSSDSGSSATPPRVHGPRTTPMNSPAAHGGSLHCAQPSVVEPPAAMPLAIGNLASGDSSSSSSSDGPSSRASPDDIAAFLLTISSSNSDTSDIDAEARSRLFPSVCGVAAVEAQPLLVPPRFIGFVCPLSTAMPPPARFAVECAVDTMCQGSHSVIKQSLAVAAGLTMRPFSKTCRTANGARVTCSHLAEFTIAVRVRDAWVSFLATALVWEDAAEQLLVNNTLALDTGLIDFCSPNAERVSKFGPVAFARDWRARLEAEEAQALAIYHEDFMPEDCDDIVDLSAPLRSGDQDVSTLPPVSKAFATKFPLMTKAIPKDAHPALEQWQAHIIESAIPLYSWPSCDLKDLKEERLPFRTAPRLHAEFDKLIAAHYAEPLSECPTVVAMRAQLVQKTKQDIRFCVNGSTQKKVMTVGVYPMPHIRSILDFVASFPFRAKLDMKHGYHNFEVHPDSRKWTTTIGAGRAIAWRKLVQGFASSGAFFQYGVCKMLGNYVWSICAVYLDDIIVVGHTEDECAQNVMLVMTRLHEFRFRINFAKCVFTPSTDIDFLGCSLRGSKVYPGPKVSTMLSKIRPPHMQLTPKGQRHHLHVFLGCCAFVMQHCPGLKSTLAPLYVAVASNPFVYGTEERRAFDAAMQLLTTLQPYHLPSCDPDVTIELFSDASGGSSSADPGAWATALGQRRGQPSLANPAENFELLQTDGGIFNARQASWDILKKEGYALFQALHRFRPYIHGRRVRVFVDSKVLMHMFRSDSPVLKRWYAYLQTFDYEMFHISSSANALVDCLSRYTADPIPVVVDTPKLLAAIQPTPAPSLLRCGDVEPNPGPPKPAIIILDSSSSSEPSHVPIVAPVSPDASNKRQTSRARRRPSQPQRTAEPVPVSPPIAPVNDSVSNLPQDQQAEDPLEAPTLSVLLHTMQTDPGPFSFCDAFANALRDAHRLSAHPLDLAVPYDPLDIRDRVLLFLEHSSTKPMALLYGKTFQQAFRADPSTLVFSHTTDTRVPESWSEYCSLMSDACTFPDLHFIRAACTAYSVQLVLFSDAGHTFDVSPPNAFRRIFLFASLHGKHFSWGRVSQPTDADADGAQPFGFDAPPLIASREHVPRPSPFSSALDISDDKLARIHEAHNAYTGHPGVAATVQQLMASGHKWRKMTAHVAQFIKRCPTCCSSRLHLLHAPTSTATVRFNSRPLRRWHIDQTGAMGPCAFTGFTIMIAFVCEVTQFTVLFGSRYGTALETAIALITLMGWLGTAESIHSDGGAENDNYVWHQITQITGIKHTFSIPEVSSSNPIAERNIQSAKRFIRSLTVDLDKHNAWGLLLPIAQKGLNDLRRQELLWHSPNEIVFASLADPDALVIPTFYSRALREADFADVNSYHISANYAHRAACFQQHVCNVVRELHAIAFDASARKDPVAAADVLPGQWILV
ncbi:MAG: DDE-type integrase/transposase/recombinase, partial [Planctomycetes bacterium]|nr:DDE-type integrase/transposase/recombinase [Planctomycetota bacterium]